MKRLATGLALAALWLLLLFFTGYRVFWAVTGVLGILLFHEYTKLALGSAPRPLLLAATIPPFFPLLAVVNGTPEYLAAALVGGLLVLCLSTVGAHGRLETNPFDYLARTGFGMIYAGLALAHLVLIRALPSGALWLFYLTVITAVSDSGAYYTGRLFGRHKLAPSISPGKTVEGLLGGLVAGCAGGGAVALFTLPEANLIAAFVGAALLSLVGVLGDLTESILKRSMNVKDSGACLPGHGGLLDRLDSLLLTAPLLYWLIRLGVLVEG